MRIAEVKLFPVRVKRRMLERYNRHIVMKVFTDEGLVGFGEISDMEHTHYMPDVADLEWDLTQQLKEMDPFERNAVIKKLSGLYGDWAYGNETVAAVDFALHDLTAKALGVPVNVLLGGRCRDRIPIAYPIFTRQTMDDVDGDMDRVRAVFDEGFSRIRIYVGVNLDADEEFLRRLRQEFGHELGIKSLDFSGRLHWKEAVPAIQRLYPYEFELVESIAKRAGGDTDWAGMGEARKRVLVPVSEHCPNFQTARLLIENEACDVFNITPISFGMTRAQQLFALAKANGIKILFGTTQELSIATAAVAHMASSVEELHHPCDSVGPMLYEEDVVKDRVRYENGYLLVPTGPGLGVEIDDEKLRELTGPISLRPDA